MALVRPLVIFFVLGAFSLFSSCSKEEWIEVDGVAWSTTFHVVYKGDKNLQDSVRTIISAVNQSLSPFEQNSTVSLINRNENMMTDSLIVDVFEMSKIVNQLSSGAFDPTVAPAVNIWGFGYKNYEVVPDSATVDSVRSIVGIGECRIENGLMIKKSPDTEFNFSAIAKGYGCDMIGRMFERNGVSDFMIEIGGEVVAHGTNRRSDYWRIMIETPEGFDNGTDKLIVNISDCSMATSGNYRNFKDTAEGKIGHTLDPNSCRPVSTDIYSASVIATTAMFADALATACMVLGADKALRMIENIADVEALFILSNENEGGYSIKYSSGFKKYFNGEAKRID